MEPRPAPTLTPAGVADDRPAVSSGDVAAPPRQRWRLVLARSADAPRIVGRELSDAWEDALEASGLPVHRLAGRSRTRVAFAAPLPLGVGAEHELAEVFLAERIPIWQVREALIDRMLAGWRLVDLFDVWVGGPPLAGRVVAADYRIDLETGVDVAGLAAAARSLLAARELPRVRAKGDGTVSYDLRRLVIDIGVDSTTGCVVRARTRIHPEFGTGRPEEVVAAIGDQLGRPLTVKAMVRERLVLADEPG